MSHIHDLIDFIVSIFIVHEDKVLLIYHRQLNRWLPIGGHIELNEDLEEALFRETKEECGLEIEVLSEKPTIESKGTKFLYTPSFLDIHKISETHQHVGLVYFAKAKSDKFIFNEVEHKDIRWFSKEDLEKSEFDISPAVKFYAKEALGRF
ncbi:MAG: NUDIX domain-containing protein [Patescibacteria group bacterium]|nr:NUDIX domain-containing protein [Patescibacteria group bacterium]MDD5490601.1 NUDIX domain-containing protein [Patescibacteria group bacterium]